MSVVTLVEAKAHLNLTVVTYDAELQSFLNRAEAALAKRIGPLAATAKTERVRGWRPALYLSFTPIISLTSVTSVEGLAIPTVQLTPSPGGRVEYIQYGYFPSRFYDVAYQAGRATLEDDLKLIVLELVRLLWSTQRGGRGRPGSEAPAAAVGDGLLSMWVEQLSAAYRPVLGA
jgi:hypothetical protein